MHFKVNFVFNQADNGWTETWYRESSDAVRASDVGPDVFRTSLNLRSAQCMLEATRAQEESGFRRMHLDLARIPGKSKEPADVKGRCGLFWINFTGGRGRHLYLRGLPDEWVRWTESGRPNPPGAFLDAAEEYYQALTAAGFRGRLRNPNLPWHPVTAAGPDPDNPGRTRIEVRGGEAAAVGSYIYFGTPKPWVMRPGTAYFVAATGPGWVSIVLPWPALLAPRGGDGYRVKQLEFEYPTLAGMEFRGYSTRKTWGRYQFATWEPLRPRNVPISPCQRIVDMIRRPYVTRMRFRVDDDGLLEDVRWVIPTKFYDRKDGELILTDGFFPSSIPFAHPFGSRNWDLQEWPELPLGETYERTSYHHGLQRSVLTGEGLAGRRSFWEGGAIGGVKGLQYSPRTGWP